MIRYITLLLLATWVFAIIAMAQPPAPSKAFKVDPDDDEAQSDLVFPAGKTLFVDGALDVVGTVDLAGTVSINNEDVSDFSPLGSALVTAPDPDAARTILGIAGITQSYTQQAWVVSGGSDDTGTIGRRDLPFATVDAALDAASGSGTVVWVGVGTFTAPTATKLESGDAIIGARKPSMDADGDDLEGGTIFTGSFAGSMVGIHNIILARFGVDASGQAQDAIMLSGNGTPSDYLLADLVCLGSSNTNTYHGCAVEGLTRVEFRDIETRTSTHGVVFKGTYGRLTGIRASDHQLSYVNIKALQSTALDTTDVTVQDVEIYGESNGLAGAGLKLYAADSNVSRVNVSNVRIRDLTNNGGYAVQLYSYNTTSKYVEDVMITDVNISNCSRGLVNTGNARRCVFSNWTIDDCNYGVVMSTSVGYNGQENWLITNWHIHDCATDGIYILSPSCETILINNVLIDTVAGDGIYNNAANDVFSNDVIFIDCDEDYTGDAVGLIDRQRTSYTIYSTTTATATDGDPEDTLLLLTFSPYVYLTRDKDAMRLRAGGAFASNANSKRIRMDWGSNYDVDTTAGNQNGGRWELDALCVRVGSNSQLIVATISIWPTGGALSTAHYHTTASFDGTDTKNLRILADGVAADDITMQHAILTYVPGS